jgi:hypothetical protein
VRHVDVGGKGTSHESLEHVLPELESIVRR